MVRPEPDQALGEADVGGERGIEPRLGFGEIELLRRDADGRPLPRRRVLLLRVLLLARRVGCISLGCAFFGCAFFCRRPRGASAAARCWNSTAARAAAAAAHELGRGEPAGVGAIELGDQRAARIGRDRGDRSGARSETEPVQRQRRRVLGVFGIKCHASPSANHRTHREWMRFSLVETEAETT